MRRGEGSSIAVYHWEVRRELSCDRYPQPLIIREIIEAREYNNAATTYFVPFVDLEGLTTRIWDEVLDVNLKGTFFACRAGMPYLKARKGNIVNIASVAGVEGSGSSIAYAASKGAVITLTKSLAKAFAPDVRVNAVAPGPVQTRWLVDHQDMVEDAMKLTPLKRPATAEDIADVTLFLATGTSLMTGQILIADGGRTI